MLNKISRYAIILIIVTISAVHLPNFYWKLFGKRISRPIIYYSPVIDDFVYFKLGKNNKLNYIDASGKRYNRKKFEALLPFDFYRDLDKWGVLPDTIKGIPIDVSFIRKNSQSFRISPYKLHNPLIQLFPLFESKSDFTNLELPNELFRIGTKIEFITAETNTINDSLTKIFTEKLTETGFSFPATFIDGNPTTRKPFDEGYFIVDSKGFVFHVKRVKGKPFCVKTNIPPDLGIRKIFISENPRREFYGTILTQSEELYLLTYDNYKIIKLPLDGYNPDKMSLVFLANPIYRVIRYSGSESRVCVVTDKNYNLVDTYEIKVTPLSKTITGKIEKFIFPFTINTRSGRSKYVNFDVNFSGFQSTYGIIISLLICFFVKKYRRENLMHNFFDFIIIAVSGMYGLLAVLLVKPELWD